LIKKTLKGLALLVALLALGIGGLFYATFSGLAPIEDGKTFAGGKVLTIKDGHTTCFLVQAGGGDWVLIDACMDPKAEAILKALTDRGWGPEDIDVILLTHGHPDHVGGVKAFPRAEVRALAAELPLLKGREKRASPVGRLMGQDDTGVRINKPLKDGEKVVVGGDAFEVFAVPGHTPGSAVFLAHGILFMGDSASLKADGAMINAPWIFSVDLEENGRSLVALYNRLAPRSGQIKTLVFAHTGAADGMAAFKAFNP
jgi:glyoxylase-like metal-dependent hydrolase (beta-lactamase superfamily II)